jgi:hypothetical protein
MIRSSLEQVVGGKRDEPGELTAAAPFFECVASGVIWKERRPLAGVETSLPHPARLQEVFDPRTKRPGQIPDERPAPGASAPTHP